jgi:hypothetical protein
MHDVDPGGFVGDVLVEIESVGTGGADYAGGGVAGGVVQIGEDDMGAFPGEGCGAGGADEGGRP